MIQTTSGIRIAERPRGIDMTTLAREVAFILHVELNESAMQSLP
jgi:hypothetical protein